MPVLVAAVVLCCGPGFARAAGPSWLDRRFGEVRPAVDYAAGAYCDRPVAGQRADVGLIDHRLRASTPISQDDEHEWLALGRVDVTDVDTSAVLPDTRDRFPSHLWDIRLGTSYRAALGGDWILGGGLTVGSPSDRPFVSPDEIAVDTDAFLRIPHDLDDAWVVSLNWSNNREYLRSIPLPGLAYYHVIANNAWAMLGAPVSMISVGPVPRPGTNPYRSPESDLFWFEASYAMLRTVHAKATFQIVPPLKAYAAFDWDSRRYLRHDRRDAGQRLFRYEKRLTVGLRWEIASGLCLDVSGGYAFDRLFFEGDDYDDRGHNRLNIADGPFVALAVGVEF